MFSNNLFALILAGGSGSRLWPMSREMYPKQLLKIGDENTLFQSTFLRLLNDFNDSNIISSTNIKHEAAIKIQLKELQKKLCRNSDYKVITEPVGRNTAPAIALAIKYIVQIPKQSDDPIILVTPSDHLITDDEAFSSAIQEGAKLAEKGYIVTFGVKPKHPDTGFGYIKTKSDKKISEISTKSLKAASFTEKPNLPAAKRYIKAGNYFWNSGIFMFKASTMLEELSAAAPEILDIIINSDIKEGSPSISYSDYDKMPDISIDYAVMEKSKKIALLPLDCGWNDLGSWEAIYDTAKKDKKKNYILGNVIDIDSKNSMIYSSSKLITTIGLKDTVVVETEDAILICDKSRTQDVKKIYAQLQENKDETFMIHKTVYRPWGYYTVLDQGKNSEDAFLTKCICVNPNSKLSLQYHHHRSEHWVVLEGTATVQKGEKSYTLNPGESIDLQIKESHSLENNTDKPLKILEVQKGKILDENDIVRLKDIYGRA